MRAASAFLFLAVAVSGAGIMSLEMAAARMLLPYYGDSHLVWANLIGVVLASLAAGYYLGGTLADRYPHRRVLTLVLAGAGLWSLLLPLAGNPVLRAVQGILPPGQLGFVASSLLAALVLLGAPSLVLGFVPPFAIRLALSDVGAGGSVAGSVYAVSTIGSMAGTFGSVLWLLPAIGVRATFAVTAAVLLATAAAGMALPEGRRLPASPRAGLQLE